MGLSYYLILMLIKFSVRLDGIFGAIIIIESCLLVLRFHLVFLHAVGTFKHVVLFTMNSEYVFL